MRLIIITVLTLIISACASKPIDGPYKEEIKYAIKVFEQNCALRVMSKVMFDTLTSPAVGACYMGAFKIYLDLDFWANRSTPEERFNLMMHELGHCELFREHDTELTVLKINGVDQVVPKSIMYPYVFPIPDYPGVREYYMSELCGRL
jgi:hypothetical protein